MTNLRPVRGWHAAAAALVIFAFAACDDGGGNGDGQSTAAPAATAPPLPTAIVADGRVTSSAWDYSATIPPLWSVSSNFIQGTTPPGENLPPFGGDALFAPESDNTDPTNQVRANIAITCEQTDLTAIDDLIAQKVELLESLSRRNIVVTDYGTVAGVPAKKIEYDLAREDLSFEKAEVYFLSSRCLRSVALTAQLGDRAKFTPQLDSVLASFEVQE